MLPLHVDHRVADLQAGLVDGPRAVERHEFQIAQRAANVGRLRGPRACSTAKAQASTADARFACVIVGLELRTAVLVEQFDEFGLRWPEPWQPLGLRCRWRPGDTDFPVRRAHDAVGLLAECVVEGGNRRRGDQRHRLHIDPQVGHLPRDELTIFQMPAAEHDVGDVAFIADNSGVRSVTPGG